MNKLNNLNTCYSYDNLLICPRRSYIKSRNNIDLSTQLFNNVYCSIPIIAAPMHTITEYKMAIKMYEIGGLGILHRFSPDSNIDYLYDQLVRMCDFVPLEYRAFSIGCNDVDKQILKKLYPEAGIVCLDLNIGHHQLAINMVTHIKTHYPSLKIIAGNVATFAGAYDLCHAGADCIRATNGGGAACTTLKVTGVGVPSATALHQCYLAIKQIEEEIGIKKTLIADGGLKNSGDMVKALALGADACMIGNLLAGSSCCPESAFFIENGKFMARYAGMASEEAQKRRFGHIKENTVPEGESFSLPPKGKTAKIIQDLAAGMRSGFSFVNASNIKELRANSEFIIVG